MSGSWSPDAGVVLVRYWWGTAAYTKGIAMMKLFRGRKTEAARHHAGKGQAAAEPVGQQVAGLVPAVEPDARAAAGESSLLEGIALDAKKQAEEILAQARQNREAHEKAWEAQKGQLLEAAKVEAERKKQEILHLGETRLHMEEKRRALQLRDMLVDRVLQEALKRIEAMIPQSSYPDLLEALILEAALGIHREEVVVAASAPERPLITEELLDRVAARVTEISGRTISLTLAEGQPLPAQGVVLTSDDGAVAFSNQIPVRLLRYQSEIRHLMYQRLFEAQQ